MLKTRVFSAAATMALAAAAFAQPASFTDLGDHSLTNNSGTQAVTLAAVNDIQWFRIVLPAVSASNGYVDMWINGPGTITDSEMGLYTNLGAMRANDDDDGPGLCSALSFGQTLPTRPGTAFVAPLTSNGTAYNGRDGVIAAADTYWIAVGRFNVTFGAAGWTVTSSNTTSQLATTLGWNIVLPGTTAPAGVTTHAPTSGLAGSSFTATCTVTPGQFPNSTGITVSCDASAVGAGTVTLLDDGVPPDLVAGNNVFTGTINTSAATTAGLKTLNYTVADAEARSSNHSANFTIVPPPPANDTCGTAAVATTGPNAFDCTSATNDGLVVCTTSSKDVWFVFNPGATAGTATIDTCTATTLDTVVSVHTTCGGASVACNDDDAGNCGATGFQSKIVGFTMQANTNYYIRVAGFGGASAGGAGILNIDFTAGTSPTGVGSNVTMLPSSSGLITVTVTPGTNPTSTGLTVTADTTTVGGAAGTTMYDDGTNGDVTLNDNIFTAIVTAPATEGNYNVPFTVADAQARSTSGALTVRSFTPADWNEVGDAGNITGTAQVPTGTGALNSIDGTIDSGDSADMYKITICDSGAFTASTNNTVTAGNDTQLFLFDALGNGVQMDDDNPVGGGLTSTMDNSFVTANGTYYIAVSHYDNDPQNASPAAIWLDTPFNVVRAPDGGQADITVAGWDGTVTTAFSYRLVFTGTCYFNCTADFNSDNVVDFFDYLDFVDAFSANDPSADFNGDTVIDFFDYLDFVDAFSVGC